jgi:hypothetical protein
MMGGGREHLHFFYNDGSGVLECRCGERKFIPWREARRLLRHRRLESLTRRLDAMVEGRA